MGWKPVLAKTVAEYQETVHTAIRDVETGAVQVIRSDRKHPYFAQRLENSGAVFNVAYTAPPPSAHGHVYKGPIAGGAWVDAQHLRSGDWLINADGTWAEVISVTIQKQDLTAYNLSVRDYVTYFVAESTDNDAVWVHNTDCFKKPAGAKYVGNTASNQPVFETPDGKKFFLDNHLRYKDYVPSDDVARPIPTKLRSEVDPRLV